MSEQTLYDRKIYEAAKEVVESNDNVPELEHIIEEECHRCAEIVLEERNPELLTKVLGQLPGGRREIARQHFVYVIEHYYSE